MKPYAYSYNWAHVVTCAGPADWRNIIEREPPPNWGYLEGRAKDIEPLYTRQQMAVVRDQLEQERCRHAELSREGRRLAEEVRRLTDDNRSRGQLLTRISKEKAAALDSLSVFGNYAHVLRPFVALMAKELAANSHKGDRPGWLAMSREQAWSEIEHHMHKLGNSTKDEGTQEHAADVANCCMMLLDVMGLLTDE